MFSNRRNISALLLLVGIALILLSQLGVVIWNRQFVAEFMRLNYGSATLIPALMETFAGMLSGLVLALTLLFTTGQAGATGSKGLFLWALTGMIPLLALLIKFFFAAGGAYLIHPPLEFLNVWEWSLYSPVPSLWLGLVLGVLIRSRLTFNKQEGIKNG